MAIACETYKIITNCIYIYINSVNWVNRLGLSATPSAIERFSKRKKRQRVNTCTYSKVSRKKKYVQRYISFFRDIGVHVRATILCNVIARGCQSVVTQAYPSPLNSARLCRAVKTEGLCVRGYRALRKREKIGILILRIAFNEKKRKEEGKKVRKSRGARMEDS